MKVCKHINKFVRRAVMRERSTEMQLRFACYRVKEWMNAYRSIRNTLKIK